LALPANLHAGWRPAVLSQVGGAGEGSHRVGARSDRGPYLGTIRCGGPARYAGFHTRIQNPLSEDKQVQIQRDVTTRHFSRIREELVNSWLSRFFPPAPSFFFIVLQVDLVLPLTARAKAMLRIERSHVDRIVLSLSGRIESTDVAELRRLLSLEAPDEHVALDLRDITLVDRDGVRFLASCEKETVKLEHCPAYVREWIDAEKKSQDTDDVRPD
jgi:hypothetical protein